MSNAAQAPGARRKEATGPGEIIEEGARKIQATDIG